MPATGRPHRVSLGRDITLAIAAKLVALALLWTFFFSPAHRPPADAARHIAGSP